MSELVWSKNLPTKKGWYWMDTRERWEEVTEPFIVEVFGGDDPQTWEVDLTIKHNFIRFSLTDFDPFPYYWAGPIKRPADRPFKENQR